jgi:hypothetical protein
MFHRGEVEPERRSRESRKTTQQLPECREVRPATEAAAQFSVKRDRLRPTSRSHRVRREERQSRRNPETAVDRQGT